MLKISREVDLALLLMTELYEKKHLSLSEWAKEKKLPYRFLSKIAGKLKQAKLIKSREGRGGGYKLKKAAESIKIKAIIELIDGPIQPVSCFRGIKCQHETWCKHKNLLGRLTKAVNQQLDKISLKDLC